MFLQTGLCRGESPGPVCRQASKAVRVKQQFCKISDAALLTLPRWETPDQANGTSADPSERISR